ncbi:MAG: tRNA lysidine(34) synthetase TilS [Tepidisphaerales bacterium]
MSVPAELAPVLIDVPPGRYLAAVSGGCDSVSLLYLCFGVVGHVVHVHHELRGSEADADAGFVVDLSRRLGVGCTVVRRSDMVAFAAAQTPAELRRLRLHVYRQLVTDHGLDGVLLGHHADDQAETTLLRLLRTRGQSVYGLSGMRPQAMVAGVRLLRPLLHLRRATLEAYLHAAGQPWRDDTSNRSMHTLRNRIRTLLRATPGLAEAALELAAAARTYRDALDAYAERTEAGRRWRVGDLADLPVPLTEAVLRRRLRGRLPPDALGRTMLRRLLAWCADAASPRMLPLPGGWAAVRVRGEVRLLRPGEEKGDDAGPSPPG